MRRKDPDLQRCAVCDVETDNCCSACGTAGVALFFCSREHQKLVWPSHRIACGPGKANPFFVPPKYLSAPKFSRLVEYELDADGIQPFSPALASRVTSNGKVSLERALLAICEQEIRNLPFYLKHGAVSKGNIYMRSAYFCTSYDKRKSSLSYVEAVAAADPMDYAARLIALLPDFDELSVAAQTMSLHQTLVLARLLQLKVRSKAPPPSYKPEYIGGALRQLLVQLKPFVRFDDDEHAQRIACGFKNEVSQFYPIDCWFVVDPDGGGIVDFKWKALAANN
ncbi:hypothetical protein Rhopal_001934-T1 [Rhodotorula paludigena]|uniref:MYND-type domain-containing protein n=1 Tax=Rhodotorula paludigena TaxID=86838 RepID=A0AAV5GFS0_9BASI|nr:hypothetical protein Rhopal_001934-T1 [Rhodotorula paludigena]